MTAAWPGEGRMTGSGPLDGLPAGKGPGQSVEAAIQWLERQGQGKGESNYRLRDWLTLSPAVLGSAHSRHSLR